MEGWRRRAVLQFLGSLLQQMPAASAESWVCRLHLAKTVLEGAKLGVEACAIMCAHHALSLDYASIRATGSPTSTALHELASVSWYAF